MLIDYIREIDQQQDVLSKSGLDAVTRQTALEKLEQALLAARRIGDDKIQIVQVIQDLIENKTRQLDTDFRNLGKLRTILEHNLYFVAHFTC